MPLDFAVGSATATGKRERNEDYLGAVTPYAATLASRGAILAVADGVSGSHGGREAAEYCVRNLLADYYATPDTWDVPLAVDRLLTAMNRWLVAQGSAREPHLTTATTISVMVLRGNRYHIGHVGDTRIYRLRSDVMTVLTQDHVWDHPAQNHVLKRAVGLDQHLVVDHGDGELVAGDRFVICSDGLWEPLGDLRMHQIARLHHDPARMAQAMVDAALGAGGQDNASAIAVRVDAVADENWRDMVQARSSLPVPEKLHRGDRLDGFEVQRLVHESRATLLYEVTAIATGQRLALKTLQPILGDDRESREGLLAEEWLAKRLVSRYFPQVIPLDAESRSRLYYVMTFHAGATLQQHLDQGRHFSAADVVRIGVQLGGGLGALHRLGILHRDIKPANLLIEDNGDLRILDMGVALAAGVPYPELENNPGTPSYMAPELFEGSHASPQSDLYAAGVTLYQLLTRKYPYGEVEPFQRPQFGEPVPATRYRPDIPQWLENLMLRAIARKPTERFETAEELTLALERGEARAVSSPPRVPLWDQGTYVRWQAIAIVSIAFNLLLLYLLVIH